MQKARAAVLGGSGYTGAELVRLIAGHPYIEVTALTANAKVGKAMAEVFPHLRHLALPTLTRIEDVDFSNIDIAFCALPHATTQEVVSALPRDLKIVDLSADFRLKDPAAYERWYGRPHAAMELQAEAVYGLPELHRDAIRSARLVAATGCNAASANLPVIPLLKAGVVDPDEIIIDLKAGVSGAGRSVKENLLFAEVSEGVHAYNVAKHRHIAEYEQEMGAAAGQTVRPTLVAHLLPISRGILSTIYLHGEPEAVHAALSEAYAAEPFIVVLPFGETPGTDHVRGSNFMHVGVAADSRPGRAIVISVLDNLVKGASGMGLQCANLMLGFDETEGLMQAPLFP
ncbi:MAG: N-acetyl-gamma-glutamyl-phosphate reductase [Pseudomonadota bacterium]